MISIIQKPAGFKIRRKGDIKTFKNVCLCNGSKLSLIHIFMNGMYIMYNEMQISEGRKAIWKLIVEKRICL